MAAAEANVPNQPISMGIFAHVTHQLWFIIKIIACSFRCKDCDINQFRCSVCRGDRKNAPLCSCDSGYFDDNLTDKCQCID
jgi:hypothetical protein